ncbi:hypothetical protein C8R47DRAFT_1228837 [Mycena vitilis]|nr:hypothetical protein C8R47DRAFT_1228837 [Mycena vitilis]
MTASGPNSKNANANFKRRCRIYELSSAALKEGATLDAHYRMFRCCGHCPNCNNFYDHLDEKRLAAYVGEEDEPEPGPGPGQLVPIGESKVDVVFEWGRLLQYEDMREDIQAIADDDQVEIGGITVMQILQETEAAHNQHIDYAAVAAQRDIYLEQVRETEEKNEILQVKCGALGVECDQLRQANTDSAATATAHERRCREAEKVTQDLQTRCGALEAECEQLRQANLSLQSQLEAARELQRPQHAALKRKQQDTHQDECDGRAAKRLAAGKNLGAVTSPLPDRALWDQYHRMQLPDPSSDPILLAKWLQHNEKADFRGIPIRGPGWAVNMRAARGHQQVLARIDRAARYPEERRRRARSITAILRAIAVPGRYEQLILQGHIEIASQTQLVPCNFGSDADTLSDAEVASMLAGQGMTIAVADDSWLFCRDYIDSQLASPEHGFEVEELRRIRQEEDITLKSISPPQGLKPDAEDQYPRTVPYPSRGHSLTSPAFHAVRPHSRLLHEKLSFGHLLASFNRIIHIFMSFFCTAYNSPAVYAIDGEPIAAVQWVALAVTLIMLFATLFATVADREFSYIPTTWDHRDHLTRWLIFVRHPHAHRRADVLHPHRYLRVTASNGSVTKILSMVQLFIPIATTLLFAIVPSGRTFGDLVTGRNRNTASYPALPAANGT